MNKGARYYFNIIQKIILEYLIQLLYRNEIIPIILNRNSPSQK